jgi:hypothetical protein
MDLRDRADRTFANECVEHMWGNKIKTIDVTLISKARNWFATVAEQDHRDRAEDETCVSLHRGGGAFPFQHCFLPAIADTRTFVDVLLSLYCT